MIQGIRVIDFHCHFPNSGEWFPDYKLPVVLSKSNKTNRTQAELWRKAYNFPEQRLEIRDDREAADKWYDDITKKNIEKAVFVSGGGNQRLAKAASYHPDRFIAFAHHNPFSKNSAAVLEHDIKNLGLKGYKILGSALNQPLNDSSLYDLWEVCNSYKLPVPIPWFYRMLPMIFRIFALWFPISAPGIPLSCSSFAGPAPMFMLTPLAPINGCAGWPMNLHCRIFSVNST